MKLKAKNVICALALSGLLGWAFAAEAGTTTFHGVTVDYGNATANGVGEDLVLTYKGSSDSLDFGNALVNADILLVGGGGSGSSGGNASAAEISADPTSKNVDGSGAGGPGGTCVTSRARIWSTPEVVRAACRGCTCITTARGA